MEERLVRMYHPKGFPIWMSFTDVGVFMHLSKQSVQSTTVHITYSPMTFTSTWKVVTRILARILCPFRVHYIITLLKYIIMSTKTYLLWQASLILYFPIVSFQTSVPQNSVNIDWKLTDLELLLLGQLDVLSSLLIVTSYVRSCVFTKYTASYPCNSFCNYPSSSPNPKTKKTISTVKI